MNSIITSSKNTSSIIDCNYPGVVYTFPSELAAKMGTVTLRNEGGAPAFVANDASFVTEGREWDRVPAPKWWYENLLLVAGLEARLEEAGISLDEAYRLIEERDIFSLLGSDAEEWGKEIVLFLTH